jgi:pyrroline-5-carboxylate reductase
VQLGFPRSTAVKLVQNTFYGAAAYSNLSGNHLAQDRNLITSPGGTTAAALYVLEKGKIRTTLTDAVNASYNKARSMAKGSGKIPDAMKAGFRDESF